MWQGRSKRSRGRLANREEILMVNARVNASRKDRIQKISALVVLFVAIGGVAFATATGYEALHQWLFARNDIYTIKYLDLKSDGRLQPSHIREYAHLSEGANLFSIDLETIRKDLESVPLVKTAEVERKLPDTLVVRVTERTAIARIKYNDHLFLAVDKDGYVLGPTPHTSQLPMVFGVNLSGITPGTMIENPSTLDALRAVDYCDTTKLGQLINIVSVDASDAELLRLQLATGELAILPRDNIKTKLEQLADSLQAAAQAGKKITSIDLTPDNNVPTQTAEGI